MKIILDVMGGDKAPEELVKGACDAAREYRDVKFVLVGDEPEIRRLVSENQSDPDTFRIVHAPSVVHMEDDPLSVVRSKSDSSMSISLHLLADGEGDAMVSTGNTGALFTGATLIVRKVRGIQRAAIATVLPLNPDVLLLDSGANVTVTEDYLEQFAVMGAAYMSKMYHLPAPRVGLLNNGVEECKGTPLQLAAYEKLSACEDIHFVGNVEASSLPYDVCDVLVTDGFTGNVLIKTMEGTSKMLLGRLKEIFTASGVTKMSALLVGKHLKNMKKDYDPNERGGAPILGISRPVIKAHGSSNALAFKNAIRQAILYTESGVIYDIADAAEKSMERRRAAKEKAKQEAAGQEGSEA